MAVNGSALRVIVTLVVVATAGAAGWRLWDFYTLSPWTRDARVLANVVNVAPDVSGLITEITARDNQKVARGDVLFTLDQDRFNLALAQAQANVEQSRAAAKLADDNSARDEQIYARDPGAISATDVEATRTKAKEAAGALHLAQAALATAKLDLQRSVVRAPVNGYVANLTATVGDFAKRGEGVLALVDADSFHIYAYFMETKLSEIHEGDAAEARLMVGGAVLRGTVEGQSRAIATPTGGKGALLASVDPNFEWIRLAQRIPVRITIDEVPPGVRLASGLSATVVVRPKPR